MQLERSAGGVLVPRAPRRGGRIYEDDVMRFGELGLGIGLDHPNGVLNRYITSYDFFGSDAKADWDWGVLTGPRPCTFEATPPVSYATVPNQLADGVYLPVDTYKLAQAFKGNQPLYSATGWGGGPCGQFVAASSHYMISNDVAPLIAGNDVPWWVIAVIDPTLNSSNQNIAAGGYSGGNSPILAMQIHSTGKWRSYRRDDSSAIFDVIGTDAVPETPEVAAFRFTGDAVYIYKDGVATDVHGTSQDSGVCSNVDEFAIGAYKLGFSSHLNANVRRIWFGTGTPSEAAFIAASLYLKGLYV